MAIILPLYGSYYDIADQLTECAINLLIKAREMREEHKD